MNEKKITIKIPARHLEWIKKNYRKARQGTNSLFEYGGMDIKEAHALADLRASVRSPNSVELPVVAIVI